MIKILNLQQNKMKRNNNLILLANSHITIIALKAVNCYLLKGKKEYILIDSGLPKNRAEVEEQILKAGWHRKHKVILLKIPLR